MSKDNAKNKAARGPVGPRLLRTVLLCLLMVAATAAVELFLFRPFGLFAPAAPAADAVSGQPEPTPAPTPEPTPEPEPTPDPAQQRIADVMAVCGSNATKDAPDVRDPETWNQAGAELIDRLAADPVYAGAGFDGYALDGMPYLLAVNRAASTVTVYTPDENGRYTVPFMAMVCSGGEETPTGYWKTPQQHDWRLLSGNVYGQYATRIWDHYLFHSVPYYTRHKDDIEYDEFNKLGGLASLGCIRLAVVDVKWIYDNCPLGTPVVIYDIPDDPGPMGKPGTIYTDPADETLRGWDPTDPDPANPWDDAFLTGTAIRSQAAWDQWNAAREGWQASLTPTDLRGFSTDSSIEGTRG